MERTNYWSRTISRRRLMAVSGTAGAGLAALALTGCGDDDDSDDSPGGETPAGGSPQPSASAEAQVPDSKKNGTLLSRQGAAFASINPYKGLDSGLLWGFTIFDHLFYTPYDTGVRELFLASKIETPDPLTINATIGEGFFHNKAPVNGRAIKATDVKASLESASKQTRISNSSWWTTILSSVAATDDKNITVKLKAPDAWTFTSTNFGSPIAGSIIPEEIALDPDRMDTALIGSGRYEFVSHENGTNFQLKRAENWRIKGEPWLAGINYKLIQEQALALTAFSAEEIYSVALSNKLERDQLVQQHGKDVDIDTDVSRSVWTVVHRGDGQWANPKVMQAISRALDRQEFIDLMNFGDGELSGPVPPPFGSQALTEAEITGTWGKTDIAEAKALLSSTGFDTSKEYILKFITPGERGAQFAQIVQQQLKQNLGINIKLVGEDFGNWLAQSLYGSGFDFITFPSLAYDDPSSYVGAYGKTIGGRPNWAGFVNEELDAAILEQKATFNDEARNKLVHDIQLKAWELGAPYIPVFVAISNSATWGFVKGRVTGRGSYGLFNGRVYLDQA
ncbi:MAG: ABC transporter substrate-binding protein [Dehalococcoidia bacterium]